MAEPQNEDEYIYRVITQAEQQQGEDVPSLGDLQKAQQQKRQEWSEKQGVYILLLIAISIAYLFARVNAPDL